MNTIYIFRIIGRGLSLCLLLMATIGNVWSSGNIYKTGDAKDYDNRSVFSYGISEVSAPRVSPAQKKTYGSIDPIEEYDAEIGDLDDDYDGSASTIRETYAQPSATLFDNEQIRIYIQRRFLEITPVNYEILFGYADKLYRSVFNRFDAGVTLKWPGSRPFEEEKITFLLISLKSVSKLRLAIDGGISNERSLEFIWNSLQGMKSLQQIDVSNCGISDAAIDYMMDSVGSTRLTSLDLRGNRISANMVASIRERFSKLKDLKTDLEPDDNANASSKSNAQVQEEQKRREEQLQQELAAEKQKRLEAEKKEEQRQRELVAEKQKRLEAEKKATEAARIQEEQRRREEQRQKESKEAESKQKAAQPPSAAKNLQPAVERPLQSVQVVPAIARGYEEIYLRFLNGKLIYRPTEGSDVGKIELLVKDIMNPNTLEGEFNLSRCGDTGQYLSINTGYRKGRKAANKDKVEIWFAPKFLIEKDIVPRSIGTIFKKSPAEHFRDIMNESEWPRSAEIGVFWTWGDWNKLEWYDYLTNNNYTQLGNNNIYEKWYRAQDHRPNIPIFTLTPLSHLLTSSQTACTKNFMFVLN